MATVRITTLGCKVNQCDGEDIARDLGARGYRIAGRDEVADVFIVNTCTVTSTADAKARKLIHKLAREHPEAALIVTGCYAQRDPEALSSLPGVAAVVPNTQKCNIADIAARLKPSGEAGPAAVPHWRTRAFVKVQDGCDHRCTYCVVPAVRGAPMSKPLSQAVAEVRGLADSGIQEVVLCGIRLGLYGRDNGETSLAALLHHLRDLPISRLRLSSIEPMDVDDELLAEIGDHPRLCHHLHLPLQSGDDTVLAQMARGYTRADFADLVAALRAAWPDLALSTDVMIGFPGETEVQFTRTLEFVRTVGFSRTHIFPYSARPGTLAAGRNDHVPAAIKRSRGERLSALAEELAHRAAVAWVGREVSVLFEQQNQDGELSGLTEHYLRLRCRGPSQWVGQTVDLVAGTAHEAELVGSARDAARWSRSSERR